MIATIAAIVFVVVGYYIRNTPTAPSINDEEVAQPVADDRSTEQQQSAIRNPQSAIESASDTVWAALDAAGRGDVAAYAELLTGELRDRFTDTAAAERDGERLKQTLFGVKGIAVMAPQAVDVDTRIVEAEFQYADRKEGQRFGLRRGADAAWRIERIEPARPLTQTIPYGTPVNEVPAGAR